MKPGPPPPPPRSSPPQHKMRNSIAGNEPFLPDTVLHVHPAQISLNSTTTSKSSSSTSSTKTPIPTTKKRTLKGTTRKLMLLNRLKKKNTTTSTSGKMKQKTTSNNSDESNNESIQSSTSLPAETSSNLPQRSRTASALSRTASKSSARVSSLKSLTRSVMYANKLTKGKITIMEKKGSIEMSSSCDMKYSSVKYNNSSRVLNKNVLATPATSATPPATSAPPAATSSTTTTPTTTPTTPSKYVSSTVQGKIDPIAGSLPVKDVLKGIYRVTRVKTLLLCTYWAVFMMTNAGIFSLLSNTSKTWEVQSALEEVFLDEEIPGSIFKKNFHDVMNKNELWDWIDGVLVPGIYPDEWYNGKKKDDDKIGYIVENTMRVVGGVRIRQHRVPHDSCTSRRFVKYINETQNQPERCSDPYHICPFDRKDQSCFSEFQRDPGPFWREIDELTSSEYSSVNNNITIIPRYSQYNASTDGAPPSRYTSRELDSVLYAALYGFGIDDAFFGFGATYGKIGFVQDLPTENRSSAIEVLSEMKKELWLDDGTRAVGITFTVYNTMTRTATVCRFTIEFAESGHVYNRGKFYTFPLVIYGRSGSSRQRTVLEVIALLVYVYFVQKELRKSFRMGARAYFCTRKSTIIELSVLLIYLIYFVLYYFYVYEIVAGKLSQEFHVMSTKYVDYINLALTFKTFGRVGGIAMLAGVSKILKLISLSKQAMLLIRTLSAAQGTLTAFSVFFVTLWIGFAYWGQLLYGDRVWQFSTMVKSMLVLFRLMLADSELNYEILLKINPEFTPIFYLTFQFVFLVLLMNMLVAILVQQFDLVKDQSVSEERWKQDVPPLMTDVSVLINIKTYRCRKWCSRDKMALKMSESIQQTRHLYAEDPEKWAEAYHASSTFWRGCEEWEFFSLLRKLAHIGKEIETGPSINLLALLEKLYIQWEDRSRNAIESGAFGDEHTDGRMPIACISASRILLMISNAPPPIHPMETDVLDQMDQGGECSKCGECGECGDKLGGLCGSCCKKSNETPENRQRRLYRSTKLLVEKTIRKYNEISDVILVAPVISDAEYWTNDEAIAGESLQVDLNDRKTANRVFKVRMSVSGKSEKWQTIYMDVDSAQLYILTPVDKRIKSNHEVRRSIQRIDNNILRPLDHNISVWFGRNDKNKHSNEEPTSNSRHARVLTQLTSKRSSKGSDLKYIDTDGALWMKLSTGGRIKIVLDMLDLQQMHVDRIDLQLVSLFFEDSVGAFYRFRFNSFARRCDFVAQAKEVTRRIQNGHGWTVEEEEVETNLETDMNMPREKIQRQNSRNLHNNNDTTRSKKESKLSRHSAYIGSGSIGSKSARSRRQQMPSLKVGIQSQIRKFTFSTEKVQTRTLAEEVDAMNQRDKAGGFLANEALVGLITGGTVVPDVQKYKDSGKSRQRRRSMVGVKPSRTTRRGTKKD